MLSNGVKHWFATFGHGQTHPLTGEELVYCYTLVPAETEAEAQSLMMRTVFGQQWAFLYERADGRRGAGVEQYKLREVPFISPSPMSEAVWAAFEKIGDPERPDWWVEKVSQPIELAWYRWHAAQQDEHIRRARLRATAAAVLTPDADTLPHDPGEYDVARGIDPYAIPANRFGPPPSDLPRSAEEEQAEAASGVNDRSLTAQVAVALPLSSLTLAAVQAEAIRAHAKHGPNSMLNPDLPWSLKLAALVEEVGEAAHELTYDQDTGDRSKLVKELVQVASVALTWVESIEGGGQ